MKRAKVKTLSEREEKLLTEIYANAAVAAQTANLLERETNKKWEVQKQKQQRKLKE